MVKVVRLLTKSCKGSDQLTITFTMFFRDDLQIRSTFVNLSFRIGKSRKILHMIFCNSEQSKLKRYCIF